MSMQNLNFLFSNKIKQALDRAWIESALTAKGELPDVSCHRFSERPFHSRGAQVRPESVSWEHIYQIHGSTFRSSKRKGVEHMHDADLTHGYKPVN
jgi:hypothetical protein